MVSSLSTFPPNPFHLPAPNPRFFMPSSTRSDSTTKSNVNNLFGGRFAGSPPCSMVSDSALWFSDARHFHVHSKATRVLDSLSDAHFCIQANPQTRRGKRTTYWALVWFPELVGGVRKGLGTKLTGDHCELHFIIRLNHGAKRSVCEGIAKLPVHFLEYNEFRCHTFGVLVPEYLLPLNYCITTFWELT